MIYFVSGHLDLTKEEFAEHYEPKLMAALGEEGSAFVVGDARGCDAMAARYITLRGGALLVFHMFDKPRNTVGGAGYVGGFVSDEDRDMAMTRASHADIAWVRPKRVGKWSGTEANLLRRQGQKPPQSGSVKPTHQIVAWRGLAKERQYKLEKSREKVMELQEKIDELEQSINHFVDRGDAAIDREKALAQAGLDLVVGFQIRCSGPRIQLGNLELTLEYNDTEVAKAIELILTTAERFNCQGLDLLTPYEVPQNMWEHLGPFPRHALGDK